MFGFLKERRARTVVANVLVDLADGIRHLSPVDRSATLAMANQMLAVAEHRWGPEVAKGPGHLQRRKVVEIVLALAASHAGVVGLLAGLGKRGMADLTYAQAMREVRASEVLIATLGAALVPGAKPQVGESWRLMWGARERSGEAAVALMDFARHADADPVPRTPAKQGSFREAEIKVLAETLPGFLVRTRKTVPVAKPASPLLASRRKTPSGGADKR